MLSVYRNSPSINEYQEPLSGLSSGAVPIEWLSFGCLHSSLILPKDISFAPLHTQIIAQDSPAQAGDLQQDPPFEQHACVQHPAQEGFPVLSHHKQEENTNKPPIKTIIKLYNSLKMDIQIYYFWSCKGLFV